MKFVLADPSLRWSDLWFLLDGALNTLMVTAYSIVLGTLVGVVLGWARANSFAIRIVTTPYIDIVRSVPLLIQLILLNSFFPLAGYRVDPFWLGTLVLSSSLAATTAEVVRAGFLSVPATYRRASRSLGMNYLQELFHVSAPLAFRTGLTAWIGLILAIAKDSALISVVGYVEFLRASQILIARTHEALLLLGGVGLFYFVICYPVSRYSRRLERRIAL